MKIIYALPVLALLASCETFGRVASDPTIQAKVGAVVEDAASGNWVGAAYGAGGLLTLIIGKMGWDKVKASEPGKMI